MREEVLDEGSGAILFKKSKETKKIEELEKRIKSLEAHVDRLEKLISKKEKKEDS